MELQPAAFDCWSNVADTKDRPNTLDEDIVAGALVAISTSRFLRSCRSDLLLRFMQSERGDKGLIHSIFNQYLLYTTETEASRSEVDSKLLSLASTILESSSEFPFHVVSAAAEFLYEHYQLAMEPLLVQEGALGIAI